MPEPVVKIELGADLGARDPNTFLLNDATRGRLNNTLYTLSGDRFFDITDRLLTASTSRGKNQALDRIDAGQLNIVLDNFDRLFDPLYENGFYYSQLIPGREIRISCNGYPVIYGTIDDIDIAYEPGNRSVVSMQASDGLSTLTINNLPEVSPSVELSGARVTRILDLPEVAWPTDKRDIDTGNSFMSDTDIAEGTQAVAYLQLIATSEAGELFVSKDNKMVFKARNSPPGVIDLIFTDQGPISGYTTVPFAELGVVYGTEELYNRIVLTNDFPTFPEEATAEDAESQLVYGPRSYTVNGLLNNEADDLQFLADFLLARFKDPQYRFSSLSVILDILSQAQQDKVLDLEIGDVVQVRFTPSGIPPAIEQYVRVIGISHDWQNNEKRVNLSLERLDFSLFILNDAVFGVLDDDRLSF
ncbi:hypothetical protein UFOVP419_49 [uncultured Caudovirales phage]|uniref:Uncharacterized protein n=1 Tax=uncultured Caudovirales phage TaxID=2100421 RepID=A0A6J5M6Q8_9CAUD|nr:hypothetical protein UFOVP419_49 [uncultured Caudovirales phage]